MPRYFFHVFNDEETRDEEGADLPDTPAAVRRAADEARILAAESIKEHGHLIRNRTLVHACPGRLIWIAVRTRQGCTVVHQECRFVATEAAPSLPLPLSLPHGGGRLKRATDLKALQAARSLLYPTFCDLGKCGIIGWVNTQPAVSHAAPHLAGQHASGTDITSTPAEDAWSTELHPASRSAAF
jgi:hypothetical protein